MDIISRGKLTTEPVEVWSEGRIVMVCVQEARALVRVTKHRSHWLDVGCKQAGGSSKCRILNADKSDYEKIRSVAKDRTGKDVETLRSQEGVKRPKQVCS